MKPSLYRFILILFGIIFTFQLHAQKQYPYSVKHKKPHYEIFDTNMVVSKTVSAEVSLLVMV